MHLRLILTLVLILFSAPAAAASINITIDISEQKMYVQAGAFTHYSWDVSTARKNYRTPIGSFAPTRMYERYFSKKYHGSPMPFSIFFYGGYAIHGTSELSKLGTPASHGCIRLDPANAERLFALVKKHGAKNTSIKIRA